MCHLYCSNEQVTIPQESSTTKTTNDLSYYFPLETTQQYASTLLYGSNSLATLHNPDSATSTINSPYDSKHWNVLQNLRPSTNVHLNNFFNMNRYSNLDAPVYYMNDHLTSFLHPRRPALASTEQMHPYPMASIIR